ncbi:MAG: ROK family protein, partial [Bacillota bacterium]
MSEKTAVMAFDIGGTTIKCGLIDSKGEIIYRQKRPSEARKGAGYIFGNLQQLGRELLQFGRRDNIQIECIGISTAGTVEPGQGVIAFSTETFKGWQGSRVKDRVKEMFGLPVYVENDAHAAAWGEKYFGIAGEVDDFVMVTLGTGIGGAIFSGGKLFTGAANFAGLIGMMSIDPRGYQCQLGVKGCLESYTSAWGIARLAEEFVESGNTHIDDSSLLVQRIREQDQQVTPEDVFEAARTGDILGNIILDNVCLYLGTALGSLVSILNPEMIVLA